MIEKGSFGGQIRGRANIAELGKSFQTQDVFTSEDRTAKKDAAVKTD